MPVTKVNNLQYPLNQSQHRVGCGDDADVTVAGFALDVAAAVGFFLLNR